MKTSSHHILRVGLGITFLWIGILIFRDPQYWSSYMQPWAANLLFVPAEQAMLGTAVLDVAIGLLLLIDLWVWVAGLLGTFHLITVLIVSGIDVITVRDIGLLSATVALFWTDLPETYKKRLKKHQG